MKFAHFVVAVVALASTPAFAGDSPISGSLGLGSGYVFESQATVLSYKPVINAEIDWKQSENFGAYIWAQKGEVGKGGTEIDVVETFNFSLGKGDVHGKGGIYIQPLDGINAIYTLSAGVSYPVLAGFELGFNVQGYAGALKSTNFKFDITRTIPIGELKLTATVGHAWNTAQLSGLNPWYGTLSLPLGKTGMEIGARGFVGAGHGGAVSLTYHFH